MFERSTNAIALLDEQRVYIEANPALCELLGASRDEIVGARADRFVAPEELTTLQREWRQLWASRDWVCERTLSSFRVSFHERMFGTVIGQSRCFFNCPARAFERTPPARRSASRPQARGDAGHR